MKINQKMVSYGFLGIIGVQVLFVSVGLSRRYSYPQGKWASKKTETIRYNWDEIFYGTIGNNSTQTSELPMGNGSGELKISLVGFSTGTSGDSAIMSFPV